tara:strand:- start:382 stop:1173 length:792 start_codon:yes stop_codon:yes gene_type:complete
MPSFTSKTFSSFYKNLLGINQAGNTGVDATVRTIQDGAGTNTALSLSERQVAVTNTTHNSTTAFIVTNNDSENILAVDTDNSKVLMGASQQNALTLFKEMGLHDFSPATGGYHYPLIANTMLGGGLSSTAFQYDQDWGNADDPPATLDVSGLTNQEHAVMVYWYLENDITLDSVRYMATSDGGDTLNFHLEAYTLDVTTNHGDLSSGTTHASGTVDTTATTVKTGTLTLDTAKIDASKVVIGFVESDSTNDLTCSLTIKYHIR